MQFSGKTTLLTWESMQRNPLSWAVAQKIANKVTTASQVDTVTSRYKCCDYQESCSYIRMSFLRGASVAKIQ